MNLLKDFKDALESYNNIWKNTDKNTILGISENDWISLVKNQSLPINDKLFTVNHKSLVILIKDLLLHREYLVPTCCFKDRNDNE